MWSLFLETPLCDIFSGLMNLQQRVFILYVTDAKFRGFLNSRCNQLVKKWKLKHCEYYWIYSIKCAVANLRILTVTHLEAKVISLCHQYRTRPAYTSMQTDQALLVGQLPILILISLKMIENKTSGQVKQLLNCRSK